MFKLLRRHARHHLLTRPWRAILHDIGLFLHVPGIMALASLAIAIYFGQPAGMIGFGVTAVVCLLSGQLFYRVFSARGETDFASAMTAVALAWAAIGMVGSLPFLIVAWSEAGNATLGEFRSPLNAIFESFSGITGTGLTMARNAADLPESLQWWRSFTEWVGGVGVVVIALTLVHPDQAKGKLFEAEARETRIKPSFQATARTIWQTYLAMTLATVSLFMIFGMPIWEAINHGLTCISTGGFTITSDSFASYSAHLKWVACVMIFVGAISFRDLARLRHPRHLKELTRSSQSRGMTLWLFLGTAILGGILLIEEASVSWTDTAFQWLSAAGTCGFASEGLAQWTPAALLFLILGMSIGGAAGSTTGGLKMKRIIWLGKCLIRQYKQLTARNEIKPRYYFDQELVPVDEARSIIRTAATLVALGILMLVLGTFAILLFESSPISALHSLFEVASALGNVGLSTGVTSPDASAGTKVTLILLMWTGRLEILGVMILLSLPIRGVYHQIEKAS